MRLKTGEVLYEKSYMSPRPPPQISLRHDHDWTRRKIQLGSTVDQQPEGKVVRQSRGEVQHETFRPNQPNQSQNQSVIGHGNLRTRKVWLLLKVKRPVPMRSMKKFFTKNSVLQMDQDNLRSRLAWLKLVICLKIPVLCKFTMDQDNPDECNSSRAHTVKEQHAPDEHREIASFNTNNEFNRAINEENIDFNIPGVPHSTVKQLHWASVRELIQKIENHPNRHALQWDLHQSQSFNALSQKSKKMIHEVGNVEMRELLDMEPKALCKVCLSYWDVGIVYCTCGFFLRNGTEVNKKFVQYALDLLSIPN